jgi:hypothetical protein
MTTGVTLYQSTDGSAPVLTGNAGSLTALLTACLVNGYGAKSGAGWTVPYSGSNQAAYTQGSGSSGNSVIVNDNGPGAGGGKEARVTGYETVSSFSAGTNPFPTAAQLAAGIICRKSATADGTARPWIVLANTRTFYLLTQSGDVSTDYSVLAFGDLNSNAGSSDSRRAMIIGRNAENSATATVDGFYLLATGMSTAHQGHYIDRSYTGVGSSVTAGKHSDYVKNTGNMGAGGMAYPMAVDGGLYMAPIYVHENAVSLPRGTLSGVWAPLHNRPLNNGDTFSGVGGLGGRSFMAVQIFSSAMVFLETSDTWDVN